MKGKEDGPEFSPKKPLVSNSTPTSPANKAFIFNQLDSEQPIDHELEEDSSPRIEQKIQLTGRNHRNAITIMG